MQQSQLAQALNDGLYTGRFKKITKFIFEWECVVAKSGRILIERDPSDSGGETFCGLDRATFPHLNFLTMSPTDVCATYHDFYWQKLKADDLAPALGEVEYNCAVNCGFGRIPQFRADSPKKFLENQADFYRRLAARKPSQKKFLAGWLNRISALQKLLLLTP